MANVFRTKRSAVPSKVPLTTDLQLGEIAINTYDGKMYIKKDVSGIESVVQVGSISGGGGGGAGGDHLLAANNLSDLSNISTARTNLGLAIGTNVQAYDAGLQSIASLTTAADRMIYTTASDTYAVTTLTSFARTLLDDTTAAAMRTTLGLTNGATTTVSAFALTILDDADAAAVRTTIGAAATSHTHATSDITSGTFADARIAASNVTQYNSVIAPTWTNVSGKPSTFAPAAHDASLVSSGVFDIARIPVLPSQIQVVSSGNIAALTSPQQTSIGQGTVVTTTDGRRWIYSGSGSKTLEASYVEMADVTPEWTVIANKPSTFTPSTHTHVIADITSLQTALDGKAATSHTHTLSQISDMSAYGRTLVDDTDAAAARTTLGLGTAATVNTGTSGGTVPLLNGVNTFSAAQTVNARLRINNGTGDALSLFQGSSGAELIFKHTDSGLSAFRAAEFLWSADGSAAVKIGEIDASGIHLTSGKSYRVNGSTVWHAGNDGAGSGLDADTLDGYNVGTSGATIPLLNAVNTFSGAQVFSGLIYADRSDSQWAVLARNAAGTADRGGLWVENGRLSLVNAAFNAKLNIDAGVVNVAAGTLQAGGNTVWHAGNDGAGSTLDADLLDGIQGAGYARNVGSTTADLNTLVTSGMYRLEGSNANLPSGAAYGQLLVSRGSDTILQIASDYQGQHLFFRNGNGADVGGSGAYSAWRTIYHSGNFDPATKANLSGATFSGSVGIGRAPTSRTLEVASSIGILAPASTSARIDLFSNGQSASEFTIGQGAFASTDNIAFVWNRANAAMAFGTNNVERVRIDSAGVVNMPTAPGTNPGLLNVRSADLGGTATNTSTIATMRVASGNEDKIIFDALRNTTGVNWDTASLRIRRMVDASNHNFLEFANNGTFIGWGANRRVGIYDTTANAMDVVGKLNVTSAMGVSRGIIDFNFTQSGLTIWNTDNSPLSFGTSGVNRMQISATGIITLGTQAPQSTSIAGMRVNGNNFEWGHTNTAGYGSTLGGEVGTGAPFLAFSAEAGTNNNTYRTRGLRGAVFRSDNNGGFIFGTADTATADNQSIAAHFTVNRLGNAHLGGSSPTDFGATWRCLTIGGGSNNGVIRLLSTSGAVAGDMFTDTTAFYIRTATSHSLVFRTGDVNRLTIASDGEATFTGRITGRPTSGTNVNTNNDTGSLSVRSDSSNAASISFHRTGAFAINMGVGTDNVFRIGGWSASNDCLQLSSTGNLTALGNVTAYSDKRLKTNIETLDPLKVFEMRGVSFVKDGKEGSGVIAQEMQKVAPELVHDELEYLSVAYGNISGYLIEGMKFLKEKIEALEAEIKELKKAR